MATREIVQFKDKETGDINELRDKALMRAKKSSTTSDATNNSIIPLEKENGEIIKIKAESLMKAFAGMINSNSKSTITTLFGALTSGNTTEFGAINMSNLASVLGVGIEVVTISLTDSTGAIDPTGATVTITNTDLNVTLLSTTWQGEPIIANISTNTNYTVSVSAVDGVQPSSQSYKAGWKTARSITFDYNFGAFIESTDHQLYRAAQWSSAGKTANAVVLITEVHSFRMALNHVILPIHSNYTDPIENYISEVSYDNCLVDYDGAGNTAKIIRFNAAYGTNTNSYAAPYCNNFTFPDGTTKGYLPAAGELNLWIQNRNAVRECLIACGGDYFTENEDKWNWTSSYRGTGGGGAAGSRKMYTARWLYNVIYNGTAGVGVINGANDYYVRPFAAYE